jgi:hypothetical protein
VAQLRLTLVKLGHFKRNIDLSSLRRWNSDLFEVVTLQERAHAPDGDQEWQEFLDDSEGLPEPDVSSDITVAITEYGLEDNFYLRRLRSGLILMSLAEVGSLLEERNVPLENFILRNLYCVSLIRYHQGRACPTSRNGRPDLIHDETRSCLFDMNGIKSDVLYSSSEPCVCSACKAKLESADLPAGVLRSVGRELARIRKPLYFRMRDFVRRRPLVSLSLAFAGGLLLELIGNAAYDFLNGLVARSP